jgi:hypothetical protein
MDCTCYLREGKVYIPTLGKMDQGFYRVIEPVTVVDVSDTDALHAAFSETIARGNPKVPRLFRSTTPPIVPKYAGVRSWKAFARDASTWGINEREGIFRIQGYRKDRPGGWVEDNENVAIFPPGTSAGEVIERMIAILQEAARRDQPD